MPLGWYPLLTAGHTDGLEAIIRGVNQYARLIPVCDGDCMAWDVVLSSPSGSSEAPLAVQIAKGTVLYKTKLENHLQLIEL
jgi:hypothetical protein